jgi:hypothetical protein
MIIRLKVLSLFLLILASLVIYRVFFYIPAPGFKIAP